MMQQHTRGAGRLVVSLLATFMAVPAIGESTAAGAPVRPPKVEEVALEAVADLGTGAPAAIVAALAGGASLETVVDEIRSGRLEAVTETNVKLTVNRIRELSPILSDLERQGKIQITGCIYDLETGRVQFLQTPPGNK